MIDLTSGSLIATGYHTPLLEAFVGPGLILENREGRAAGPGSFDGACMLGTSCDDCDFSISDTGPAAEQILQRVSSASSLELIPVVEEHRDRLLLHPSRRLLVVRQETSCNARALGGLMTVSAERMAALEELGIPSLKDFLRSEAPSAKAGGS